MVLNSEVQSGRIGVVVLSGFLGAGKTTLLNRLLHHSNRAKTLVIVNEWGEVGVDHHLLRHLDDRVVLIPGGCICCTVRGALVDTLRDMFMRAMRREVPVFDRVLIETTGMAEAAPVLFSLRYEPFLAQRFAYLGCVTVVDAVDLAARLSRFPVMRRQIVEADVVALSKTDLSDSTAQQAASALVAQINPGVRQVSAGRIEEVERALVAAQPGSASVLGWLDAMGAGQSVEMSRPGQRRLTRHGDIVSWVYRSGARWRRGAFLAAMDDCLRVLGDRVLRVKGVVAFTAGDGEVQHFIVHAVHTTLYPLERASDGGYQDTALIFIAEGADKDIIRAVGVRLALLDARLDELS